MVSTIFHFWTPLSALTYPFEFEKVSFSYNYSGRQVSTFGGGTKNTLCFELCVFNRPDLQNVGGGPYPFVTGFEGTTKMNSPDAFRKVKK